MPEQTPAPSPLGPGRAAAARAAAQLREAGLSDLSQRPAHYEGAAAALEEALAERADGDEPTAPTS
jgi:hypothetical protein